MYLQVSIARHALKAFTHPSNINTAIGTKLLRYASSFGKHHNVFTLTLFAQKGSKEPDKYQPCCRNSSTTRMESHTDSGAERRPQFGNRFLKDPEDVFLHNAWDNVEWNVEQEQEAQKKVDENARVKADPDKVQQYLGYPNTFWDMFYSLHENKFFKDRNWLFTEFPELGIEEAEGSNHLGNESSNTAESEANIDFPGCTARKRVWEVGCGVGNTIFPVLETNSDPGLFVYGSDFSEKAVEIVRVSPQFEEKRCHVFVLDITDESASVPFPEASLDIIVLIFVLSALHPDHQAAAVRRLARYLRPGGLMLLRDYGRHDMAQLRFKQGRCLADNLYARGDGTLVYFFTQEELRGLFTGAGLVEVQNHADRRLQVNRGRQLKMYRVWMQCKYRKPHLQSLPETADTSRNEADCTKVDRCAS